MSFPGVSPQVNAVNRRRTMGRGRHRSRANHDQGRLHEAAVVLGQPYTAVLAGRPGSDVPAARQEAAQRLQSATSEAVTGEGRPSCRSPSSGLC